MLFSFTIVKGVTNPVSVLRACLNNNDSTLTLDWKNKTDACSSFKSYRIYEAINLNPFKLKAVINITTVNQISLKLPDLNPSRKYKIHTLYACNGIDSLISNIISIDQLKPGINPIDSVSVDLSTQKLVIGWTKNIAKDTKGYRIYKEQAGINDSIAETDKTVYLLNNEPLSLNITISTFDSCNLFSPISLPHKAINLNTSIDTCLREITLNWSTYKGWSIDSTQVYVSINNGNYKAVKTSSGNINIYKDHSIILGNTYKYYVRAYKANNNKVSSSSNISTINTRAFVIPTYTYITTSSITNPTMIRMNLILEAGNDVKKIQILDKDLNSISTINYSFSDGSIINIGQPISDDKSIHFYIVNTTNSCEEILSSSNLLNTIVLNKKSKTELIFNVFSNWEGQVEKYELESKKPSSSTWNKIDETTSNNFTINEEATCYRIKSIEINNTRNNETALSNIVCTIPNLTYYVPTAISLNGANKSFYIIGKGIDRKKSSLTVFNRWGQQIINNNIEKRIYPLELNIPPGIYLYTLKIVGDKGDIENSKGWFTILK